MDKITSKSSIRPELQSIYFAPDKMVATDSYRLIEVKKEIGIPEPRLIKVKGFKGRGTVSVGADDIVNDDGKLIQGERVDASYPEYEKIFDGVKEAPRFSMLVNAKLLAELLAEADAHAEDANHKVRLDFFETMTPLIITAQGKTVSVRALLAPLHG
jgi:hypothetical protein